MGQNGLYNIILRILDEVSIFYFIKIVIFFIPTVIVMFYVREKEKQTNKIKINY